jgi:hypothetical protein
MKIPFVTGGWVSGQIMFCCKSARGDESPTHALLIRLNCQTIPGTVKFWKTICNVKKYSPAAFLDPFDE